MVSDKGKKLAQFDKNPSLRSYLFTLDFLDSLMAAHLCRGRRRSSLCWFLGISLGLNIHQKPKLPKVICIFGRPCICDYSNPPAILESFCLVPLSASNYIFLSPPVRLHFSHCVFLSVLNSGSLHFSSALQSLSQLEPNASPCLHPFPYLYISPPDSLSPLHQTSDISSHLPRLPPHCLPASFSCISFSGCLSLFVSADSLGSLRAAL